MWTQYHSHAGVLDLNADQLSLVLIKANQRSSSELDKDLSNDQTTNQRKVQNHSSNNVQYRLERQVEGMSRNHFQHFSLNCNSMLIKCQ
jgi:hypothetical protein